MEKIELEAKSDRELLITSVLQQNEIVAIVKEHHTWINGCPERATPGAKTQLFILWGLLIGLAGVLIAKI